MKIKSEQMQQHESCVRSAGSFVSRGGNRAFEHISCVKMVIVCTEVTSVYVAVDLRHVQTQRSFLENEQSTTGNSVFEWKSLPSRPH